MSKLIFLLVGTALSLQIQAQTFKSGNEYNDYIVAQQTLIGEQIIVFNEAMGLADASPASIQPHYEKLISLSKTAVENVRKMTAFEKNTELRDAALELLKFYERTFQTDYKRMIELVFTDPLTDEIILEINTILDKVTNDEKPYDAKFAAAQKAFAKQFGFELIENELQEEMDGE